MIVLFFHNVVLKGKLRNFYRKVTEFLIESYLISIRKSPNCLFLPQRPPFSFTAFAVAF